MGEAALDRDLLAKHLQSRMRSEALSIRAAAEQIGCSSATLGRLLQGSSSPNYPEGVNLIRAASWLGKSLSDFEVGSDPKISTIADVEIHLRGLRDLPPDAIEALVAMVRAVYDQRRTKKRGRKEG
jgi:transcriptional regulator with XRE-family HTH domain